MRIGETWKGRDGTVYRIVEPQSVKNGQPRWWIDLPPERVDDMLGPKDKISLHCIPASWFGQITMALVL